MFGLIAAVRALRTEEETGRAELVLAGVAGRMTAFGSSLAAVAAGTLVLFVAEVAGLLLAGLPADGSALLALATTSVVPVFVGAGAWRASSRRPGGWLSNLVALPSWLHRASAGEPVITQFR